MEQHRASTTATNGDLRELLGREHAHLDRLFRDLLYAFEADARMEVGRLWNQFDAELRTHMTLEEEHLLPQFLEFNAPEAAALLREHDQLRDKLLKLGVGVDLHLTRFTQVDEFVAQLRAHAKREDALMYRWAQELTKDSGLRRTLLQRLAPTNPRKSEL
jgi:hypothetical protein